MDGMSKKQNIKQYCNYYTKYQQAICTTHHQWVVINWASLCRSGGSYFLLLL